ncbi:GtrA family protein [Paenibacillus macerans]|uniref:GtrA family protein n=1 Tax=Paenibacillus macerans TaxID=44252 RepID=UPI003A52386B
MILLKKIRNSPLFLSFLKYGIVGIIGTAVHTLVLTLCVEILKVIPVLSTVIGFLASLVISYKLNSIWTFSNHSKHKMDFIKYAAICSFGLLINMAIMFVTVNLLNASYLIGQLVSVIVVPIFNFLFSRYWVFTIKQTNNH